MYLSVDSNTLSMSLFLISASRYESRAFVVISISFLIFFSRSEALAFVFSCAADGYWHVPTAASSSLTSARRRL